MDSSVVAEELSEEGDEVGAVGRTEMGKWSVQSVCVCVKYCEIRQGNRLGKGLERTGFA